MKAADLSKLKDVMSAKLLAEQAKLDRLHREEQALRKQLADLVQDRNETAHQTRGPGDAALQAGADVRWHRWIDARRGHLNQELALLIAKRERQLQMVRKAFGRNEAVDALRASVLAKDRLAKTRRLAQE